MKLTLCVIGALLFAGAPLLPFASAQDIDGGDVSDQLTQRDGKINKLTIDEQLKLRAAQKAAAEDPAVKQALQKRSQAIEEFRKAMHASLLKADPGIQPILDKIAVGASPGF